MAVSNLSVVTELLYEKLANLNTDPKLTISFPSVSFSPPNTEEGDGSTRDGPYLVASIIPNSADLAGLAFDSDVNDTGLLAVNVVWPAGQGAMNALRLAQQLARAFGPGTVLGKDGVDVRVYQQPRIAQAIEGNDDVTIPVTIRWVASTPGR